MPSTFPKVKKSYSWETSSVSKEEEVYLRQHFTLTDGGITKQMNYNYPRHWNQWKHWAKLYQLGSKCDRLHIFYDILAWNVANKLLQFARRSWTPLLRRLPLRGERENWEKLFLSCGRFHSLLVAFRNSKPRRHSEIKQTSPSTKQDFSGEALSKQNTEASLASLSWLVPGDDRVVRHICIRCMRCKFLSNARSHGFSADYKRTGLVNF